MGLYVLLVPEDYTTNYNPVGKTLIISNELFTSKEQAEIYGHKNIEGLFTVTDLETINDPRKNYTWIVSDCNYVWPEMFGT